MDADISNVDGYGGLEIGSWFGMMSYKAMSAFSRPSPLPCCLKRAIGNFGSMFCRPTDIAGINNYFLLHC
uniref:Uncharacterized protein n=1 Tax=Caenorhabditis tropicalis TaxID=1561998 RepID=A0A1I7UPP7_9PELO